MKRTIFLLLLFPLLLNAQLFDNFSDGNFTENPPWTGTGDKYIVNTNFQLQLNSTEAATTYLSTPYTDPGGNVEWRFFIRLNFSPSASNYSDVYLVSNQANLAGPLNGYFLRFGENLSLDAIELYRKTGTVNTKICRGVDATIANAFSIYVRVVRTSAGLWTISIDKTGSGIYLFDSSGTDNTYQPGGFFGFFSMFTISNAKQMYYDDVLISQEIIDNTPPQLVSATPTSPFAVNLVFNEGINTQSLTNAANYVVSDGIGNPSAVVQGATQALATLQLASPLENGKLYTLTISNIKDMSGNTMPVTQVPISFYVANTNDVVINEIMADPTPLVGLPDWEFVELFNNTNKTINLNGWKLFIGTSERLIGQLQLPPNGFVVLAHENARNALQGYAPFFGFSSFTLTNAGATLTLKSPQNITISTVSYSDTWYNDTKKKDGGWTLEQIDPTNPCGGKKNWTASNSVTGGTPGAQNSVFRISDAKPKPEKIKLVSPTTLQIWFDQQMDLVSMGNKSAYNLTPGNMQPALATTNIADPTFVELVFSEALIVGTIYRLNVSSGVLNCAGRPVLSGTYIELGVPHPAEPNDVVINEILFNPLTGGNDFVELYNRSNKIINLEDLRLGAVRQTIPNPPDTTLKDIISSTWLLMPKQYAVLTVSTLSVTNLYYSPTTDNYIEITSFPTYSNELGNAILVSKDKKLIDNMKYTEKMHFPLINYVKGVSLERISPDRPSLEVLNWHSASQTTGYATPGYQNSVYVSDSNQTGEVVIDPEVFSPDNDGRDDVTSIRYNLDNSGYTMNIHIYNANGQDVRHLVKSALVSQIGAVSWDGLDEQNRKVPSGIYVVYVEVFSIGGKVKSYKKAVVITTR